MKIGPMEMSVVDFYPVFVICLTFLIVERSPLNRNRVHLEAIVAAVDEF